MIEPVPWGLTKQQFVCKYKNFALVDELTGEIRDFDCKSWKCSIHAPINLWRWKFRLSVVPWQLFLTLTLVPDSREKAAEAWTAYIRVLRKDHNITTFLRTLELGAATGMRHYHILLYGSAFINASALRSLSEQCGFGRRTTIKKISDRAGAVAYVSKTLNYCLKEIGLEDPRIAGWRRITCSRDIPSWKEVTARLYPLEKREISQWILSRTLGGRNAN